MNGSSSTFRHPHRVTYAECTVGNHIYYARYLDLLEAARGEFFRHLGKTFLAWQQEGVIFPVIECRLRYRAAARYDDLLATELWISDLERIRLTFEYRIMSPDQRTLAEASTIHVCTGVDEKPRRVPDELRKLLSPYCAAAPAEVEQPAKTR